MKIDRIDLVGPAPFFRLVAIVNGVPVEFARVDKDTSKLAENIAAEINQQLTSHSAR